FVAGYCPRAVAACPHANPTNIAAADRRGRRRPRRWFRPRTAKIGCRLHQWPTQRRHHTHIRRRPARTAARPRRGSFAPRPARLADDAQARRTNATRYFEENNMKYTLRCTVLLLMALVTLAGMAA